MVYAGGTLQILPYADTYTEAVSKMKDSLRGDYLASTTAAIISTWSKVECIS